MLDAMAGTLIHFITPKMKTCLVGHSRAHFFEALLRKLG